MARSDEQRPPRIAVGSPAFTERLLDTLQQAHERFLATADASPVFAYMLEALIALTDSEHGFLDEVLVDERGERYKLSLALSNIAWDDESRGLYEELKSRRREFRDLGNLAGRPATTGELTIANDAAGDPRARGLPPGHPPVRSFLGMPLHFGGALVGVAGVANRPGGYDEGLAAALAPLLSTCASILHAHRQRQREQRHLQELEEQEQRFRTVTDHTYDWEYWQGPDGQLRYVSPSCERITGYRAEEFMADPRLMASLAHPEDPEVLAAHLHGLAPGEPERHDVDFRILTRGGEERWISHACQRVYDARGAYLGRRASNRDITDRKRAEQALRESQRSLAQTNQILSAILDHTDVRAVLLDREFNFVWVNRAYADSCGREPAFFPGRNHFDLYPHAENQAIFRRVVETGERFFVTAKPFEFPDQPERGLTYWDWSLIPVREPGGEPTHLVFTLMEVTERVRAEERTRALAMMVDSAPNSITVHDAQGRFRYANQKTLELHQYTAEEFLATPLSAIDVPESDALFEARVQAILEQGEATFEVGHYRRDGSVLPLEVSVRPMVWHGEQAFLSIGRDITERKQAEEALRQRERQYRELAQRNADLLAQSRRDAEQKSLLLHEVNHRVKNNLTAVIGLLYAQQRFVRAELRGDFQAAMKDLAGRIEALAAVHGLLSAESWQPLRLSALFAEIMGAVARLVPEGQQLWYAFAGEDAMTPARVANAVALLLFELGCNALKHALPGVQTLRVTLAAAWTDQVLTIELRDDGPGFPDAVLAGERSNLGLYLVRTLVAHDLRGEVELANDPGAVVRVRAGEESGLQPFEGDDE